MKNKKLRFRWGYLKTYFPYKKFAFGFVILGLLVYKPKNLVYYRSRMSSELKQLVEPEVFNYMMDEVNKNNMTQILASIPYDFRFPSVQQYNHYDIDRNIYWFTVEGRPKPLEEFH